MVELLESIAGQMNKVVDAIAEEVTAFYCVHVQSGTVFTWKDNSAGAKYSPEGNSIDAYEQFMNYYVENMVAEEDREEMRKLIPFSYILDRLQEVDRFSYHYKVRKGNQVRYFRVRYAIIDRDSEDRQVIIQFKSEDLYVDRKQMMKELEIDELTGIYTRQAFFQHARRLLEQYPNESFDLIIADINGFRTINKIYGEATGDEILKKLAKFYLDNSADGLAARYGGDQFVGFGIARKNRKRDWLLGMVDQINSTIPISQINIKYGVYEDVDRELSIAAMCDRALLAAKSIKHNYNLNYAKYRGIVSQEHEKAIMLEARFDDAIKNEEFEVWYQPKFDIHSETIVGAEALVRWKNPDGSYVYPNEFIPIFEADGLIIRLDEYVFRKVCDLVCKISEQSDREIPISVNLSRASIFHENVVDKYCEIVKAKGIEPKNVPLEITETAVIDNPLFDEFTNTIQANGFELHMDDFGSGVSSLASFQTILYDMLKIDKSLIDHIGTPLGDEFVKHIIELAHFKGVKVVAEGVEEGYQIQILRELKCDFVQGYYYCKPRPIEELVHLFNNNLIKF